MSSKRRQTWTTWHSCTRDGQHGCERDPCRSLWSSEGRNPPKSTGSGAMEPQSTMQESEGGCRDPPSDPHRIPVAQLHLAIQLTQRNGSASVFPRCVGSSPRWGGGVGGGQGTRGLNYPPNQPLYQQQNKYVSTIKTNRICHRENLQETVYPLLEQRSAVISDFLDCICARVEGKGDPVSEGSCF